MLINNFFKKRTKEQQNLIIKRCLILIIILSSFILLFSLIHKESDENKLDLSVEKPSLFNNKEYKVYPTTIESLNLNYNIKYSKMKDLYLNGNESMLSNNEKIMVQSNLLDDSVVDLMVGEGRLGVLKNLTHDLKNLSLVSNYILLFGVVFSAVFSALLLYRIVTSPGIWQFLIIVISLFISYLFGLLVSILFFIFYLKKINTNTMFVNSKGKNG